jgi:hypothetical protein
MSYLLIILVVCVALSPLIAMKPSPRQRQIAGLREAAALNGLYVELRDPPLGGDGRPQAFYGCRRGKEHPKPASDVLYCREGDDWTAREGAGSAAKFALLAGLPETVNLASEDRRGAGVYWDERGDSEEVRSIAETLKALVATI